MGGKAVQVSGCTSMTSFYKLRKAGIAWTNDCEACSGCDRLESVPVGSRTPEEVRLRRTVEKPDQ